MPNNDRTVFFIGYELYSLFLVLSFMGLSSKIVKFVKFRTKPLTNTNGKPVKN